jgi:hypothetical protein
MDKWDELTHRVQQALLAEEPEAAMSAAFSLVAEFGRTLETISGDMDRIATTLEGQVVEISGEPAVHDL